MVQAAVTEKLLVTTVGRERLIVELLPINELCLVYKDVVSESELDVPQRSCEMILR